MFFRLRTHHLASWLALFAILMMSLAPAISQTLDSVRPGSSLLLDICTTEGRQQVEVDTADWSTPQPSADHHLSFEHCPYCAAQLNLLLPPAQAPLPVLAGTFRELPRLFLLAPQRPYAWTPSSPRAPPLSA